jgi:hypothetical protein
MGSVTRDFHPDLSPGELVLLRDAQTDDVSFRLSADRPWTTPKWLTVHG